MFKLQNAADFCMEKRVFAPHFVEGDDYEYFLEEIAMFRDLIERESSISLTNEEAIKIADRINMYYDDIKVGCCTLTSFNKNIRSLTNFYD